MHLFVAYAVLVWFASFRWRRQLAGVAALVLAMIGLHLFNLVHNDAAAFIGYDPRMFRGLMYPYMVLVAAVGLYLYSFPRELPRGRVHCRACWYDLSDHEDDFTPDTPCPECGVTPAEARSFRSRRHARKRLARARPPEEIHGIVLAADHPDGNADQQHTDR